MAQNKGEGTLRAWLAGLIAAFALTWGGSAMAAVATQDLEWAHPGDLALLATIYRGEGSRDPLPVIIDVHGGAWSTGDRTGGRLYDMRLAEAGFLVIAIDFRQGPAFHHPAASADVTAAVRWVRLNAAALGADQARIGLVGSSSGGHLAMLAALRPDVPQHRGTTITRVDQGVAVRPAPQDEVDASVAYVIGLWPVSDPAARFRYARRASLEGIQRGSLAYYETEAAMWDASIPRIVTAGEPARLVPLLVVQPGEDSNVPQDMTFDLLRAYQARGGDFEYAFFPGQPHAFGHRPSEATDRLVALMIDFARRHSR